MWHLVGDGIVLNPIDVQFAALWRHGASDTPIFEIVQHFEQRPDPNQFDATLFETDATAARVPSASGDRLVLRFSGLSGAENKPDFIPNADGKNALGRIPSLTLPK